jgi:hypothetical protein
LQGTEKATLLEEIFFLQKKDYFAITSCIRQR